MIAVPKYMRTSQAARISAYVLLSIAGTFGFWKVGAIIADRASEAEKRSYEICESANELRSVLIVVIQSTEGSIPIEGLPPEITSYLKESAERGRAFREESVELLALEDCEAL